jgi:hypothetical protein
LLLGFPLKEYEVCINGNCEWVAKDILPEYIKAGATVTGNHRMGYSIPTWVPQTSEPVILYLDDFSRCSPMLMQAVMEIINLQAFTSWSLPKGSTIILSENPDNADYTLGVSLDAAQKSRYITFDVEFDVKVWSKWAGEYGLRDEAINFLLWAPELITKKQNLTINARSMTTFFNTISGIKDWSTPDSLALILNIANGCFDDDKNTVGNMFTTFINNKLHKLITPEELLTLDWDKAAKRLEECVYEKRGSEEVYRADIASILSIRLINHIESLFNQKGTKSDPIVNRILEIIDDKNKNKKLLSEDLIFNMIKTLTVKYPARVKKLITNKDVIKRVIL